MSLIAHRNQAFTINLSRIEGRRYLCESRGKSKDAKRKHYDKPHGEVSFFHFLLQEKANENSLTTKNPLKHNLLLRVVLGRVVPFLSFNLLGTLRLSFDARQNCTSFFYIYNNRCNDYKLTISDRVVADWYTNSALYRIGNNSLGGVDFQKNINVNHYFSKITHGYHGSRIDINAYYWWTTKCTCNCKVSLH